MRHQCAEREIQSRKSGVTRSKTERALQTLGPPHCAVQLQGVFCESSSLSNFPHSTLNISVLLLHVNWLQLKFTYTRGYNGVFLTYLHFTELLTFAIFIHWVLGVFFFCVSPCPCNTMLWRRTNTWNTLLLIWSNWSTPWSIVLLEKLTLSLSRNSRRFMEHAGSLLSLYPEPH